MPRLEIIAHWETQTGPYELLIDTFEFKGETLTIEEATRIEDALRVCRDAESRPVSVFAVNSKGQLFKHG